MNYAIIAAGQGSRLVTEGVPVPKPLVNIDGRPMIGRLIDIFLNAGAESITVIVNEEMTQVADYLKTVNTGKCPLRTVVKTTPDSMNSFHQVAAHIPEGKFILTTVDTIFNEDEFRDYVNAFENAADDCDGYMAVTSFIDDEKPLYINVDQELRITAYLDAPDAETKYISGGIYGLTAPKATQILDHCIANGVSRMRNYQRKLVEAGLYLKAYPFGKIVDVDHTGDIETARDFLKTYNYDK